MFDRAVIEKLDSPAMAINGWRYIIYVPYRGDIEEDYASTMREAKSIKRDLDAAISRGEYEQHRRNNPVESESERNRRWAEEKKRGLARWMAAREKVVGPGYARLSFQPKLGDYLFYDSGRPQNSRLMKVTRVTKMRYRADAERAGEIYGRVLYKDGRWGVEKSIGKYDVRWGSERSNPSLVILSNPSTFASERSLREVWSEFHLRGADKAKVIEIPDIKGLPSGVMVLGAFEGVEAQRDRMSPHPDTVTTKKSHERGPWVVTDAQKKNLWIVGFAAGDLKKVARFDGWFCRAIYYYPNARSGKHHSSQGFRHEFGETGEGGRPQRDWHRYYPEIEVLGPRAIRLRRPKNGYTIEDRGIVG